MDDANIDRIKIDDEVYLSIYNDKISMKLCKNNWKMRSFHLKKENI